MESKLIALESVGNENEQLRNFLEYILLGIKLVSLVSIYCDYQAEIVIAKNNTSNGKN